MSLLIAARLCDIELLCRALSNGEPVNDVDAKGWTALHWAVTNESVPCIELLLQANCSVDIQNSEGMTCLSLACYRCEALKLVKLLIDACRECIDLSNNSGETPLMIASAHCTVPVVDILIKNGADINKKDKQNKTALWYAKSHCNYDVVQYLLSLGADNNKALLGVLEAARYNNSIALRHALELGLPVNEVDESGNNALHHVVQNDDLESLRLLRRAGCIASTCNNDGETPLFTACYSGAKLPIVQELLEANSDCANICNAAGVYPLMEACNTSDVEVVRALIKAGAEVNVLKDGYSALWDANTNHRMDIYDELLKAGANPIIGSDIHVYIQYLLKLWQDGKQCVVLDLLKISKSMLHGDVQIFLNKLCVVDKSSLGVLSEVLNAFSDSGVDVHFMDVGDEGPVFEMSLTLRFNAVPRFVRLWLASQSCAIKPDIFNEKDELLNLKCISRSAVRNALAYKVRSEKIFKRTLQELHLPRNLQLYVRYLEL